MENLAIGAPLQKLGMGFAANPCEVGIISKRPFFGFFKLPSRSWPLPKHTTSISALYQPRGSTPRRISKSNERLDRECFLSLTSSSGQQTSSVGVNPQIGAPSPYSQVGSPLFWVGVGVALSALFSWAATSLKKYAMQQAFKTMMGQMDSQNNQFVNAAFSPGSPFPYPTPPAPSSTPLASTPASQRVVTVDVPPTKTEAPHASTNVEDDFKSAEEPKKSAFVDVCPAGTLKTSPFEKYAESVETESPDSAQLANQVSKNGSASEPRDSAYSTSATTIAHNGTDTANPVLSVEALEKMMEDPTVQKMVYPYLPEEMRNPTTFKWMLQNPQYRQQLQDMLNNMGGGPAWDSRMMDSLKNFDISSPEVKQQFDQIGLTPEEVISKIMANPDVAMAFQNPRVQAAIMDCSQNPLSIAKYQNDKEVMDVFNKISELFPGVTGSP